MLKMRFDRKKTRIILLVWMVFLITLNAGCASKEEKRDRHLERAREHIEAQEFKKAVIELKNVIQLEPKNDAAYYELGESYLKLDQGNEAFQAFSTAASINPDNIEAQLKVGQIFLLGKMSAEARDKVDLVLEKDPKNIEALNLLAGVQVLEKELDQAIETLNRVLSEDSDNFKAQLSLGRIFIMKKEFDLAEGAYLKAISMEPSSLVSYMELSRIYGTKGEWSKAESALKDMIQVSEARYQNLPVLAHFYESRGNWDQAEKVYQEAASSSPGDDIQSLMNLGGYYARRKQYDTALDAMNRAASIRGDDLEIQVGIARILLDAQRLDEAGTTIDKILEKDKGHVFANYLKGRLLLHDKKFASAMERFDMVLRENPSGTAFYYKALCLIGKGDKTQAKQELLKAVEHDPGLVNARLILAESFLRERDKESARQHLDVALERSPENVKGLILEGSLKILEKDAKGAEITFQKVIEIAPESSMGYVRLGLLYSLTGRPDEAVASVKKGLEQEPQNTNILALLVSMHIRGKRYEEAYQECERYRPDAGSDNARLGLIEYLEGKIFLDQEEFGKAQLHFEKAIEIDQANLSAYVALARLHVNQDNLDGAISKFRTILELKPEYVAGHMSLGTLYEQKGDISGAEEHFRKALALQGDFAPAANNLAWIMVEREDNIDEALNLARIAKEKMPTNALVMDTLGWIFYKKGVYLSAIAELQESQEQLPDNPLINYHLGMAYYGNNQLDAAGEFLRKALEIDPKFKGADEARDTLKAISASGA